jgi:hypothetical protein
MYVITNGRKSVIARNEVTKQSTFNFYKSKAKRWIATVATLLRNDGFADLHKTNSILLSPLTHP